MPLRPRAISILIAICLSACGSKPLEDPAHPNAPPPRLLFHPPSGDPGLPEYKADLPGSEELLEGKLLGPVHAQLYFAPLVGNTPLPDVVVLRAIGTEPVAILRVVLRDNPDSPFGAGASEHFAWSVSSDELEIQPAGQLKIEVRYLADVYGMQSALLEIRTDSVNLPLIQVQLTGKVIQL